MVMIYAVVHHIMYRIISSLPIKKQGLAFADLQALHNRGVNYAHNMKILQTCHVSALEGACLCNKGSIDHAYDYQPFCHTAVLPGGAVNPV